MKLIDWLRKLGILRFGAEASVYHNAKDRPASLQMDGVFNSEKDVIDLDKRRGRRTSPGSDKE
jgi:hypothetical protein